MSWYKVGRVAVVNGSTTVTGVNTRWAGKLKAGDIFSLDGDRFYEIAAVADAQLTLATPFAGASAGDQAYVVITNFTATTNADLAVRVSNLLQVYEAAQAAPEAALAAQAASEAAAQRAEDSATDAADSALAALTSEEAAADSALAAAASAAQAVVDVQQAVQSEAAARVGGDSALGGRIDAVTTRVSDAEAAIVDERTLRVSATNALTASIQAEVTARSNADASLSGAIATEENARVTADTALGNRVTAVETGKADKAALGTAAAKNAPATGNAATGEVVLGSDTRLSDARPPTAHSVTAHSDWPAGVSLAELGYLDGVSGPIQTQIDGKAAVGSTAALAHGTAAAGTATTAARSDHVHPLQTTVSGNAGTATKLQTARTINGVAFDGSANITINAVDSTFRLAASEKGAANGVAPLGADSKVPAAYLPSYVDDVLEYATAGDFPATGETGKIYTATGGNRIYRWSGSGYVEISASPGSTDAVPEGAANLYHTAARAAAAAPVQSIAGRTGAVVLTKADVGLGNVDNTADSAKAVASAGKLTTARTISLTGGVTGSVSTDLSGNPSIAVTVDPAQHTHAAATTTVAGLMSAADKSKLDGVAAGATAYTHPASHPPGIIAQDANNRFVSDAEKEAWAAKAGTNSPTFAGGVNLTAQNGRTLTVLPMPYQSADYTLTFPQTTGLGGFWYVAPNGTSNLVADSLIGENAVLGLPADDEDPNGGPFPPENVIGAAVRVMDGNGNEFGRLLSPGAILDAALGTRPAGTPNRLVTDADKAKLDGLTAVPAGAVQMFAGATAPSGWLLCDGAAVSRTTYAALFAAIGTAYGAGNGSTTFNLPDLRDRAPVGASASKARGSAGGASTVTLTAANLPAHSHTVTIPLGTDTPGYPETSVGQVVPAAGINYLGSLATEDPNGGYYNTFGPYRATQPDGSAYLIGTASGGGAATAVDVTNPYQALHFIIKT